jgi:hypothetical protein
MIWIQHDFYKNFIESFDSEDIELSLDIFRSEISELLTYKSEKLFDLFKKVNIPFNKKQSYEVLLDTILREIKTNKKFVNGLAFLFGENNDIVKFHKKVSWQKLLNGIKFGIIKIADYFEKNPKSELLFKRKVLDMVGLKSSIKGDDTRVIKEKDNTILWFIGLTIVGVAGYLIWRHFDKIKQDRLRAESLNPITPKLDMGGNINTENVSNVVSNNSASNTNVAPTNVPAPPISPDYVVPSDVLIPEAPMNTMPSTNGSVQINVSTNAKPTQ